MARIKWVSIAALKHAPRSILSRLEDKAERDGQELADSVIGAFTGNKKPRDQSLDDWCGLEEGKDWGSDGW